MQSIYLSNRSLRIEEVALICVQRTLRFTRLS
jgi:hypothetical protein